MTPHPYYHSKIILAICQGQILTFQLAVQCHSPFSPLSQTYIEIKQLYPETVPEIKACENAQKNSNWNSIHIYLGGSYRTWYNFLLINMQRVGLKLKVESDLSVMFQLFWTLLKIISNNQTKDLNLHSYFTKYYIDISKSHSDATKQPWILTWNTHPITNLGEFKS